MNDRKKFFKKLKDEGYTILLPNMLDTHFELLKNVFIKEGYKAELLKTDGREIKDEGLKNIHNDACYPALIVTGQFINALKSGKYDLNKVAVIITQTGGGCRASNYLPLIKKALKNSFPQVPVISLNASGLEKERSLPLNLSFASNLLASVYYGDLLMNLYNQTKPYENFPNQVDNIQKECIEYLNKYLYSGSYLTFKKHYLYIINKFKEVKLPSTKKVKVGIVGEIFVKYSPLANNHLVDFLIKENTQPVVPSLLEFLLYCLVNNDIDHKYYGRNKKTHFVVKLAYNFLVKKSRQMNKMIQENGFEPYDDFDVIKKSCKKIIDQGVKMGEGWLIPSEMVAMAENGINNIVCAQPFGCLPNHIVGKGMIRPIKKMYPNCNIAPIDYDPGATKVNQENRIKLMLSNIENEE